MMNPVPPLCSHGTQLDEKREREREREREEVLLIIIITIIIIHEKERETCSSLSKGCAAVASS